MIRLVGVSRMYRQVRAVDEISLEVTAGERIAILGPSGSGKTTLLRLIAGFERPDAGSISLDGSVVSTPRWLLPPHQRQVGLVFQAPTLWPHMTAAENVAFGLKLLARREREARVENLLTALGMRALASRRADRLSGGEARRVAIARALAPRPRFLLLDEPLTNLDPALKEQATALLQRELVDTRATLLYVTHEVAEADGIVHRTVRMSGGRLADG